MVSLFFRESNDNLLQKWERFIDELSFHQGFTLTSGFFCSLASSQIDKINFTHDNFFRAFDFASDFEVDGENTVASGAVSVEFVFGDGPVVFTFK